MKKMIVTVCQIDPRASQIENYIVELKLHIAQNKSDFVLLPEMCFAEWLAAEKTPSAKKWATAIDDHNKHIAALSLYGAKAIMGTRPSINSAGSRRNQAYLWTQESNIPAPVHEKYYLPDEEGYYEHSWYDRGEKSFDLCRTLDMRIGVQICTEMWFLEWARHYARSRADILCVPRATPHGSTDKWLAGGRASAVCAGAYNLSSNLWCPPCEKANCGGLSWIIDPEGNVLATTSEHSPFASAEIDLNFARKSKQTYPRYVPE